MYISVSYYTYIYSGDLAFFDGLNEVILSVGLVRPKPGIFQDHVVHLLVLCTTVDIVILGVSFTSTSISLLARIYGLVE